MTVVRDPDGRPDAVPDPRASGCGRLTAVRDSVGARWTAVPALDAAVAPPPLGGRRTALRLPLSDCAACDDGCGAPVEAPLDGRRTALRLPLSDCAACDDGCGAPVEAPLDGRRIALRLPVSDCAVCDDCCGAPREPAEGRLITARPLDRLSSRGCVAAAERAEDSDEIDAGLRRMALRCASALGVDDGRAGAAVAGAGRDCGCAAARDDDEDRDGACAARDGDGDDEGRDGA